MNPPDHEPPVEPPTGESQRQQGPSPVAQTTRGKLGNIAGFIVICLVVAFLLVTGGHKSKQTSTKLATPAAGGAGLPPALADSGPTGDAFAGEVPNNPQHYGPAHADPEVNEEKQKAEARRHSPMLIFDASGHDDASASTKPTAADPLSAVLATQLQNASSPEGHAGAGNPPPDRSSPAEAYAQRTQAFARDASAEEVPEVTAHRITMYNRIAQGKMVPAILETAINSDLPGRLRAIISQDVWSEDGSRRLIRRGSRLAGEYRSGLVRGQTRVFVIWTRMLQPDGTDIAIGSPGTDDIGRAGLTGTIDRHFAERFGAAFLLSLIGSATTASQGGNTFIINTSQGFGEVAQESLQDSINIPPTIYVDQGTPVQVFVARDLVFDLLPPAQAVR